MSFTSEILPGLIFIYTALTDNADRHTLINELFILITCRTRLANSTFVIEPSCTKAAVIEFLRYKAIFMCFTLAFKPSTDKSISFVKLFIRKHNMETSGRSTVTVMEKTLLCELPKQRHDSKKS